MGPPAAARSPGEPTTSSKTSVVLVDGDCVLCDGFARFVSAFDARGVVLFATQQSEEGRAVLRRANAPMDLPTIVLVEHDARAEVAKDDRIKTHVKSTAILRALTALGLPLSTLGWAGLALVPRRVRDGAYDVVARYRHVVFGRKGEGGSCALPDVVVRRRMGRKIPRELLGE